MAEGSSLADALCTTTTCRSLGLPGRLFPAPHGQVGDTAGTASSNAYARTPTTATAFASAAAPRAIARAGSALSPLSFVGCLSTTSTTQ